MRVVTWNLDGLDPRHLDVRTEAAIAALLVEPPDVILLQEVTRRTWHAHLRPHLSHAGYAAAIVPPDDDEGYVEAVLSRLPLTGAERHPLVESGQSRHLMLVEAVWQGEPTRLASAHLESGSAAAEVREAQASQVAELLLGGPPAVFGGDTNLRKAEAAAVPALGELVDAFEAAGRPSSARFTWDTRRCPNVPGRGPRARFDRLWLAGSWAVDGLGMLGQTVVPGTGLWPSDHAGLWAQIRRV